MLGVDVTEKNLRVARMHAQVSGLEIDYRLASAADLAAAGESFDLVLNMEVVEHVEGLPDFLADCGRSGALEASTLVATINRTLAAAVIAIFGAEVVLHWLPRGTHHYRKLVRPAEVLGALGVLSELLGRDRGPGQPIQPRVQLHALAGCELYAAPAVVPGARRDGR